MLWIFSFLTLIFSDFSLLYYLNINRYYAISSLRLYYIQFEEVKILMGMWAAGRIWGPGAGGWITQTPFSIPSKRYLLFLFIFKMFFQYCSMINLYIQHVIERTFWQENSVLFWFSQNTSPIFYWNYPTNKFQKVSQPPSPPAFLIPLLLGTPE